MRTAQVNLKTGLLEEEVRFQSVIINTERGEIVGRYYDSPSRREAIVFIGGPEVGFNSPAKGELFPDLCQAISSEDGISCLHLQYRFPNKLSEATFDALAAIEFLHHIGSEKILLVGHSIGATVAICAAATSPFVSAVAALAPHSFGAEPAADLGPRCSLLLFHGSDDDLFPPEGSKFIFNIALEPKHLIIREQVGHDLDEACHELNGLLRDWARTELEMMPIASTHTPMSSFLRS